MLLEVSESLHNGGQSVRLILCHSFSINANAKSRAMHVNQRGVADKRFEIACI